MSSKPTIHIWYSKAAKGYGFTIDLDFDDYGSVKWRDPVHEAIRDGMNWYKTQDVTVWRGTCP